MKYSKDYIETLDAKTIDFCCRWLWDTLKRRKITENDGKTIAARAYAHDSNNGIEFAFDMLRILKKYKKKPEILGDFSLLDDDMRE